MLSGMDPLRWLDATVMLTKLSEMTSGRVPVKPLPAKYKLFSCGSANKQDGIVPPTTGPTAVNKCSVSPRCSVKL